MTYFYVSFRIINDRMILTAAHCVISMISANRFGNTGTRPTEDAAFLQVSLLAHNVRNIEEIVVTVSNILTHPDYVQHKIE